MNTMWYHPTLHSYLLFYYAFFTTTTMYEVQLKWWGITKSLPEFLLFQILYIFATIFYKKKMFQMNYAIGN